MGILEDIYLVNFSPRPLISFMTSSESWSDRWRHLVALTPRTWPCSGATAATALQPTLTRPSVSGRQWERAEGDVRTPSESPLQGWGRSHVPDGGDGGGRGQQKVDWLGLLWGGWRWSRWAQVSSRLYIRRRVGGRILKLGVGVGGVGFVERDYEVWFRHLLWIHYLYFVCFFLNENIATYLIVTAIQNWDSGRV